MTAEDNGTTNGQPGPHEEVTRRTDHLAMAAVRLAEGGTNQAAAAEHARLAMEQIASKIEETATAGEELVRSQTGVAARTAEVLQGLEASGKDGTIRLPHMPTVRAAGLSVDDVQAAIAERLVDLGFYRAPPMVSVRVTDSASARVFVSGAVFEPGPVVSGGTDAREIDQVRQKSIGWNVENRRLSRALQSAGGK